MEMIRHLREAAGITQRGLARELGVNPSAITVMERPGCYPKADRLPAIADALKCSIDALFGRSTSSIVGEEVKNHGV